jgi:hypothetical protein
VSLASSPSSIARATRYGGSARLVIQIELSTTARSSRHGWQRNNQSR